MASSITDCPNSSPAEWRFRLFGTRVRVQIWFWIAIIVLGASEDTVASLIWISVCLVSVLLHEFGHVLALWLMGQRAEVVLYGWGGLTIPARGYRRSPYSEIWVSLAGPAAGLVLAALVAGLAIAAGGQLDLGLSRFGIPHLTALVGSPESAGAHMRSFVYRNVLVNTLLYVNFTWGIVNLLPIYPFDGGHVARALWDLHDPSHGWRRAFLLSAVVAAIVAVMGVFARSLYMVVIFGLLAASSAQKAEHR